VIKNLIVEQSRPECLEPEGIIFPEYSEWNLGLRVLGILGFLPVIQNTMMIFGESERT